VENLELDQIFQAFEVPPLHVLHWVFKNPDLFREKLNALAKDFVVRREYAQLGNRARNRKLLATERSILARHAALSRWRCRGKSQDRIDLVLFHDKVGAANGNGG